jgi:hypothetical protein
MLHTLNTSRQIVLTPDTGKEMKQLQAIGKDIIHTADIQ